MLKAGATGDTVDQIEVWKMKKLIKNLKKAQGNGTSMISLIIPPLYQVARVTKMFDDEYGAAANIKSKVNRQSVLSAIRSVQAKLRLYKNVPPNGLVIYCGTVVTDEGKEKKMNIDFEPFSPVKMLVYLCDNKFHTQVLEDLLNNEKKFGFIVMDGNSCLFGTLQGSTRVVLHRFNVDLPKKHGRGGQSAQRFERGRVEKRHNYVRKVAETATEMFIKDNQVFIEGLVLAGCADFKIELEQSKLLDQRLQSKIIATVDVSYGGQNGFNQAIGLAAESLQNVKFTHEKKLIESFFNEISTALEAGAVETLLCWENLNITRSHLTKPNGEEKVVHLRSEQVKNEKIKQKHFIDPNTKIEMKLIESISFLDWLVDNYKSFGTTLEFVTDCSQEGSQFIQGFGGIGGILRYQMDLVQYDTDTEDNENLDEY